MRVLVVDDDPQWQEELSKVAQATIYKSVECACAASLGAARQQIAEKPFALIFVDLGLPSRDDVSDATDENGMSLLREIRSSKLNRGAVCLVMTHYGTRDQAREALKDLDISDFLLKVDFDKNEVQGVVRAALFAAMHARAQDAQHAKFDLTFVLTDTHFVFGQLSGPERFHDTIPDDPWPFKAGELSRKADRINLFVPREVRQQTLDEWRENARDTGKVLYGNLFHSSPFSDLLAAARIGPTQPRDLRLCFRGTRTSLDVPFELLHDDEGFLALSYPIVRQIAFGKVAARKALSFCNWLKRLEDQGETLRILLVASNVGSRIEAVNDEVTQLESLLEQRMAETGIRRQVVTISSAEATYAHIETLLHEEKWHIIHYAGHGRWEDDLPEHSSLVFQDGYGLRTMPASVLHSLLKNSATLLFYVNGCLTARTANRAEQGDLYGLMDSVVQADVPIVLGHRWSVSDGAARDLAMTFYNELFSSWSVEDALFAARQAVVRQSSFHQNDPGWASPVLVAQTA